MFMPHYGLTDIKGYLRDDFSQYVIINSLNHNTLIKFQRWGVLIVKIVTKHFGHELVNKKSKFIPKEKLHSMKVKRQNHTNTLIINGHSMVAWRTFSERAFTYRKLIQLVNQYTGHTKSIRK